MKELLYFKINIIVTLIITLVCTAVTVTVITITRKASLLGRPSDYVKNRSTEINLIISKTISCTNRYEYAILILLVATISAKNL
jgi:hypothetical protein